MCAKYCHDNIVCFPNWPTLLLKSGTLSMTILPRMTIFKHTCRMCHSSKLLSFVPLIFETVAQCSFLCSIVVCFLPAPSNVGQTSLEGKCKLQILQPASQFAIKPNYSTSLTSTTCKLHILQQIANFTTCSENIRITKRN